MDDFDAAVFLRRAYAHIELHSMDRHQWYEDDPSPSETRYPLTFGELDAVKPIFSNAIAEIINGRRSENRKD